MDQESRGADVSEKPRDTRNKRPWTPEKVRQRIRVGVILTRLKNHMLGKVEMTPTQLGAAKILLAKCVPDLKAVEHSGTVTNRYVHEFSDAELAAVASGSSAGTTGPQDRSPEPQGVH